MAKFEHGITGPFQGKVGTVVGSSWKGIPYMKATYKKRTKKITETEKGNRIKFAMAQSWLSPLLDFVRVGYKGYTPRVEGYIAAKSYLLKNAFEGVAPDLNINPALMKVSYGNLPLSDNITVEKTDDNKLIFSWDPSYMEDSDYSDQVMLLAYCPRGDNSPINYTTNGQFRKTGTDILELTNEKGLAYHIYFAFIAHDRSRQSDSVYLRTVTT